MRRGGNSLTWIEVVECDAQCGPDVSHIQPLKRVNKERGEVCVSILRVARSWFEGTLQPRCTATRAQAATRGAPTLIVSLLHHWETRQRHGTWEVEEAACLLAACCVLERDECSMQLPTRLDNASAECPTKVNLRRLRSLPLHLPARRPHPLHVAPTIEYSVPARYSSSANSARCACSTAPHAPS